MANLNRQITLAKRPQGFPKESDFRLVSSPVGTPGDGECLVQVIYLSVDPYMRGRMRDVESYAPPIELGQLMVGRVVGRVLESRHDGYQEGDVVFADLGWQEYAVAKGPALAKIDPRAAPISTALGVLGMPGLTAYFGLLDICRPRSGEAVVVSAAAGAVGSTVGQIAKIKGCRVVGVAGSDEKVRYVTQDLGFDAAFNYKVVDDYSAVLRELCPDGIDVYFDNVGGAITDAVIPLLNVKARVAICGQISQYNLETPQMGPRLLWHLIVKRAKVEGFLVLDYAARREEGLRKVSDWVRSGEIKYRERIAEGIENAPRAFMEMLSGRNIGKQLVRVSGE